MIRLATAIRIMPAFWLAFPVCAFSGWYVTLLYASDGYAVDATAKATSVIAFVAPFVAACAAWEGARLRRGGVWLLPVVRSRMTLAFWPLLPIVLIGLLAISVAMAVNLVRSHAGLPDARFVAMSALDLGAFAGAGLAAGLLLPFAIAGPLALALPFLWLGFIPAMDPVWLRHMTGMFRDCCGLSQDLAWPPLAASALVDLGILATAAIAVDCSIRLWSRLAGGLGALGLSVGASAMVVAGMTYAPTVVRDPARLRCETTYGVTVCVWPEHHARADEVTSLVASVRSRWQEAGMTVSAVFTEADAAVAPSNAVVFGFNGDDSSRDDIISSLGSGMLPPWPDCPYGAAGATAFEYLRAWYDSAGGMSTDAWDRVWAGPGLWSAEDPNYPPPQTIVDDLWAASPDDRRAWVERAEVASQDCNEWRADLVINVPQ